MHEVPLREHIEDLFAQHKSHVDGRLDDLTDEVVATRTHNHRDKVSWWQLASLTVALLAAAVQFS